MKTTITILLLPAAALAWPSYNGYGHGHGHSHARGAYKSGHHSPSGVHLPSNAASGPYGASNATASQAGTAIGTVGGGSTTNYLTIQSTIYAATSSQAPAESASEAATTLAGGPGGACGATVTVTSANTVTVTVTGNAAPETQASVTPSSTTPEVALPSVQSSLAPVAPVAPISEVSAPAQAASSAAAPAVAAPVVQPNSSTPAEAGTTAAPAAQAASSTPVPAPATSQTGSSSGGKRGIIIPTGNDQDALVAAFNTNVGKISWVGNQFSGPPPNLNPKFQYVPQFYDFKSDEDHNYWQINIAKAEAANLPYLLSYGEPNTNNSQGFYMDAQTGANEWMKQLQPYTDKFSVGSPGTLQNTQDFEWQQQFLGYCATLGCKISFIAVHWFNGAAPQNVQGFKDTVNRAIALANGKPVWLDNFQCTGTNDAQQAFLQEVVPWLDSNPSVQRYGIVPTDRSTGTGFLNADGSITSLGQFYANL